MCCNEAARALYAGDRSPSLEEHLAACSDCRAIDEDLDELGRAFARARSAWVPREGREIRLPVPPWRRLAIAACLLLLPLAGWAGSLLQAPSPDYNLGSLLIDRTPPSAPSSDREILATLFMEESRP